MKVQARIGDQRRTVEYMQKVAEGDAYGNDSGGGNSTFYSLQAVISAGAAGFFGLAPNAAAEFLFGTNSLSYPTLLFPILSLGFLSAATVNSVQAAAANAEVLDDDVHRRLDGSLSFFAAANLFITAISFVPNPSLYPEPPLQGYAAAALGAVALAQWWVSGRNYAKYSPEGPRPAAIIKSYLRDLRSLGEVDGLNSGIYAALTAAFVGAGLAYIFAPAQTLDLVFGTALPDTPRDVFLWQLIGAGVSTLVGPIALTERDAALENNFSRPDKRTLMAGLAIASIVHTLILLPLLGSENSGPGTPALLGTWGLSAIASTLIAIKPSE